MFAFLAKDAPKYILGYSICIAFIGLSLLSCTVYFFGVGRENRRRDAEPRDTTYDDVYVEVKLPDGTRVERKVEKEYLDLTDIQNRDFRYVL